MFLHQLLTSQAKWKNPMLFKFQEVICVPVARGCSHLDFSILLKAAFSPLGLSYFGLFLESVCDPPPLFPPFLHHCIISPFSLPRSDIVTTTAV
jgi:hypothetical protein